MALPAVIARDFGKPTAIFAPDPADRKIDSGQSYDYIRPLATIEPTAVAFGMPVDTGIGVEDWPVLAKLLGTATYRQSVVLVAWEHTNIVKLARALVAAAGGDPAVVPEWDRHDFDSIDVVRITRGGAAPAVSFERQHEGLDKGSTVCPGSAVRQK